MLFLVRKEVVYITHFKTPSWFFVQKESEIERFKKLMHSINVFCTSALGNKARLSVVQSGA